MDQQQYQYDQYYEAKTAATVIADSGPHAIATETEYEQ
jgi:hypothetical protein